MTSDDDETLDWTVRNAVYEHLVATGCPPTVTESAVAVGISADEALAAYLRLNERHALFLEPGGDSIRMAHPFSGIPTPFQVRVSGRDYLANCAWDTLGIPAVLHADAHLTAPFADTAKTVSLSVTSGRLAGTEAVVQFLVPFRRWYDDLIYT